MNKVSKINVLGTNYRIRWVNYGEDAEMDKMEWGGYCDGTNKEIVMLRLDTTSEWCNESEEAIELQQSETMRHELIHAFLNESGLTWNSGSGTPWARNEEMVDWIAIQFPKILAVYQKVGCI